MMTIVVRQIISHIPPLFVLCDMLVLSDIVISSIVSSYHSAILSPSYRIQASSQPVSKLISIIILAANCISGAYIYIAAIIDNN